MSAAGWLLSGTLTLVVLITGKVLGDLASKEVQGRLDQLPLALLRVARRRLPAELREAVHEEWWLPDLHYLMEREADRPITRLVRGLGFAMSQIIRAGRTAKAMGAKSAWVRVSSRIPVRIRPLVVSGFFVPFIPLSLFNLDVASVFILMLALLFALRGRRAKVWFLFQLGALGRWVAGVD